MPALPMTVDVWFVNLGLKISDMKRSFSVFGYEIYFYGCVIAVSVLIGLAIACLVAKKTGQDPERYFELVVYAIIFGVIGARLYYVIFAWDNYKNDLLQIFNLRAGGLAIYGAVIGGVATAVIYSRKKKLNPLLVLDTACCGLIAGQCTGRWSNFINMEAFGRYTDGPLAMALNLSKVNSSMVAEEHLAHQFTENGVTYIQVHPTFLYESLWSLGVLLILLWFSLKKKKKFDGQIFLMYLAGYSLGRFWIEGLRTDQLKIGHTNIAVSQLLAAVLVAVSLCLMIVMFRRQKLKAAAVPAEEAVPAATQGEKTEEKDE
ncbi:MAG: prolipoprotein diacylglyceryl transferase [Lachnospiraceae bacterium]|nr:prolipoprotein diacylglyceryl transferase [Lachnospiraceae bacterium]